MSTIKNVFNYLAEANNPLGPTEIGLGLGYNYNSASSAIMGPLKKLASAGLVQKTAKPVKYQMITPEGEKFEITGFSVLFDRTLFTDVFKRRFEFPQTTAKNGEHSSGFPFITVRTPLNTTVRWPLYYFQFKPINAEQKTDQV